MIPTSATSFCLSQWRKSQSQIIYCFKVSQWSTVPKNRLYARTTRTATNNCSSTASFSTVSSLLTLFSKFFSSFLRSTCSLSVSHKYLALEEVYLPFRAAFPNNPTLRKPTYGFGLANYGVVTLFGALFQETYARTTPSANPSRLQFYTVKVQIFNLSFCLFTRRYWGNPS